LSQVQLERAEAPAAGGPLLSVKDLRVEFSRGYGLLGGFTRVTKAVDGVSFDIGESEILSLVGESGSGKTTIARCVAGLTPPTSGSITYKGEDVTRLRGKKTKWYRKEVQIAFQDPFGSLNPRHSVLTVISTPLVKLNGEKNGPEMREHVVSLLTEVGLNPEEVSHKLPHQLSGGERQRVAIARALASRPNILVADEPTSMLDASQRLNMLSLLIDLRRKRKMAILLITHDLATAKVMGGRTAVVYLGRLFELGPTNGLLSTPHHPYTELLLSATPRMKGPQREVVTTSTIEKSERLESGCVFRPRCGYATEVCKSLEPPLEQKTEGRYAACHNWLNRT
jgi:oligopeptide/dipeptide ABC transporter ATP-binding protein